LPVISTFRVHKSISEVTEWREDRGYGFLIADGTTDKVFVHLSD
jgi:cold shock CspA family protein